MAGGRVAAILAVFIALVLVAILLYPMLVNQEETDTDGDGIPDRVDEDDDDDGMPDDWEKQYQLNPLDASDADQDTDMDELVNLQEYVSKTDPRDPDTDHDNAKDGKDLDPRVDIIVVFQFLHYTMEDPGDIFGGQVDVYFKIAADNVEETSDVINFDTDDADVPIDYTFIYDAPDTKSIVKIAFSWFDKDILFDDKLDVSGIGNTCDLNYSVATHTWSGDTSTDWCSGNDDGSTDFDEDDISVQFLIYDSLGSAEEIDNILSEIGSENGIQDFNQMVRAQGHVILDNIIQWCLDNPEFFLKYGDWGAVVAAGLWILGIAVYWYNETYLVNEDG